jgi:hypothetical protein
MHILRIFSLGQRPKIGKPRATPWVGHCNFFSPERAAQGRFVTPPQGFRYSANPHGVALGFLVEGLWPEKFIAAPSA